MDATAPASSGLDAASSATGTSSAGASAVIDGIGVGRSSLMRAIDDAVAPSRFEWGAPSTMRDGTPQIDGHSFEKIMGASIIGPPDDVIAIQVSGLAVTTPDEALVALAALRVAVPEAEPWWRGTFDGPPEYQTRTFGRTTVGWTRSTFLFDGDQSALVIAPTVLLPTPTPTPTQRPTPPPPPDLLAYLPTDVNGLPITTTRRTVASLPDDDRCLPVCRWQVRAYAKVLGIDEDAIEVAVGTTAGAIDLAVIRVPPTHEPFLFLQWETALQTTWPELFRDAADLGPGRSFEVLRQRQTAIDEIATAWYVRDLGDTLVIVSDASAQAWGYAPRRRVTQVLETLPTPQ